MYQPEARVFDTEIQSNLNIQYGIEDVPKPWWKSLYFALQVTLVDFTPFIWAGSFLTLAGFDNSILPAMISASFICMGINTLIQSTIGNRLPIVQGPSAALVSAMGPVGAAYGMPAVWGSVLVGGLIEAALGGSRLMSKMRGLLTPVVIGSVVTSIGFSAAKLAIQWTFANQTPKMLILALVAFFVALILRFACKGILSQGFILVTTILVGVVGGSILGVFNWGAVASAPWIALPKFFPFKDFGGANQALAFVPAAIVGVFAGYIGSAFESVGDYAATCAACGEPYRIKHIDRGIMAEGLGCAVSVLFGGLPCTSYTQNIGIIAATGVCSRRVTQVAAICFLAYGLCPKLAYLLSSIPRSVIGAVFLLTAANIMFSGIDTIVSDKRTMKNTVIAGSTLAVAVMLPYHCASTFAAWCNSLPAFLKMVMTSHTLLAVLVASILHVLLNMILKDKD